MKTPEEFMRYFRTNYPGPDTIIHSPDWHAPKIYAAALHASAYPELLASCEAALQFVYTAEGFRNDKAMAEILKVAIGKAAEGK